MGISRRLITYIGGLVLLVGAFHVLHQSRRVSFVTEGSLTASPSASVNEEGYRENHCASLGGFEDVFIIVRTGSNEVYKKLPPLLNTTLPCFRHYGIWSDLEEEFAGLHIADALDEIDPSLVEQHSDFEYYRYLQEHGRGAVSSDEVAGWTDAPNTKWGRDTPAWKLDKWKFIPVAKKAYRKNPTSKWYIFIEGDTYVLWASLLAWLSDIDASQPYYIGRQMNLGAELFAYGGAGIIISNPAMELLVEQHTTDPDGYNELTINQWAGDFILSAVMSDAGVDLSPAWPTLEGEMPSTLDLKSMSSKGHRLWCYYAGSYHHMTADDIYSYYDFERKWTSEKTEFPRHGDIFRELVFPRMKDRIPDWDNLSADVQSENATFEECRELCESQDGCLQFSLTMSTCKTSSSAKLGTEQLQVQGSDERVDSGWILQRVESFMEDLEATCSGKGWIIP
ncbi:hypothetical protein ANO14919_051830 [Xylariales sp. No.14919]|nr:hypothetical protein ANO14919_051830 [Xylariales sp. No.14919]